jgi:hypothetical protein
MQASDATVWLQLPKGGLRSRSVLVGADIRRTARPDNESATCAYRLHPGAVPACVAVGTIRVLGAWFAVFTFSGLRVEVSRLAAILSPCGAGGIGIRAAAVWRGRVLDICRIGEAGDDPVRVLRPGGWLALTYPGPEHLIEPRDRFGLRPAGRRATRRRMRRLVQPFLVDELMPLYGTEGRRGGRIWRERARISDCGYSSRYAEAHRRRGSMMLCCLCVDQRRNQALAVAVSLPAFFAVPEQLHAQESSLCGPAPHFSSKR